GSCRSTSSSSGRTRAIRRVASATVAASATTVRSSWLSSTSAMPRRTISWSSTIITRTGCRTSLTLSGRRHAGAAYLQLHVQHDLRRLAAVLGRVDEQSGSPLSELDRGYGHRGQRWGEQPGHRYVVEPHHGHRLRHCYPAFGEPAEHPQGQLVVERDHCGHAGGDRQVRGRHTAGLGGAEGAQVHDL